MYHMAAEHSGRCEILRADNGSSDKRLHQRDRNFSHGPLSSYAKEMRAEQCKTPDRWLERGGRVSARADCSLPDLIRDLYLSALGTRSTLVLLVPEPARLHEVT